MAKLLLVDDDAELAQMLAEYLGGEGFSVAVAHRGDEGLARAAAEPFDAVILDVMLPGRDGFDVLRELRKTSETPVLMLTARDQVSDRVAGLDAGADDYLPKPFSLDELLARVRALLRRATYGAPDRALTIADLRIDQAARRAWRGERELELTKTEFDLLLLLATNAGVVLEHSVIYDRIWGYDFGRDSKALAVYVGYLRRKLEADGEPRLLRTVRGVGYTMREP